MAEIGEEIKTVEVPAPAEAPVEVPQEETVEA